MIYTRDFPRSAASVALARRFVAQHFRQALAAEAATLMVSELATNCVRHALSAFTITINASTPTTIRVEVSDLGHGDDQPRLRDPAPTESTGRGLQVVASLANEWGAVTNESGGHTVWFTLSAEAPASGFSEAASAAYADPHPKAKMRTHRFVESEYPLTSQDGDSTIECCEMPRSAVGI